MFNKIFILNAMIFLVFGCQKVTQKAAHLFDFARYKELKVQTVLELVVDKDSGYSNILIKEQKFPLKGKLRVAGQWQDIEAFRVGDESGQLLIASSEIGMPIDLVVRLPHEFSEDSVLLHFQVDIGNAAGLHLQGITGGQLESMSVAQLGIAADANPRIVLSVASSLAVALVKDKNNEIQLSKETISDFQNLVVVLRDYQKTLQDNVKRDESFSGSDYIENLFSRMATGMQSDQTLSSKIVTVLEQVTKDSTVAQETVKEVSNNTLSDKLNDTVSNTSIFVEKDKASNTEDSPDQTPPTAGGSLSFSNLAETAMTVTWPAATDNKTGQSALLYKLVRAETAAAIDTITEADAITGNSLIMDWTANTLTKNLTGLANLTRYHFAVLVKDSAGNKTLYLLNSQATLDLTAPTAGGTLSFSNIAESTLTVSWPAATDALTAQTGLSYKLVRASAAANIDTVAEADAITGASVAMDWTNQGLTKNVTGLTGLSTYHFAVLVKDAAGNKTLYPLNSQATLDQTAPVLGTAISFSSITSTSMTVSWGTASDALTSNASSLQYKLVTASNLAAIDTIAEVDAISNSSRLMNWTAGDTSESVTGLVQNTAYYFAVLVKDGSNNMTLYSPAGTSSSCGCAAGTYANSSSCVAAETGYYATSCERAACSNKPSHSTYLGDSFSSNRCAWACDNGYVANSSFTACDTNANYVPLSCGSNQLIVGITGRAGSWMDKLGVRCQVFENGALTGSISSGTEYGGNGGSAMAKDCPSGSAISEIDYGNHVGNGLNVMGRLRFRCTNLSTGSVSAWYPGSGDSGASSNSGTYYYGTGTSLGTGTLSCAAPYYLNWMTIGSSGAYAGVFSGTAGCRSAVSQTNIIAQWQFENNGLDSSEPASNPLTAHGTAPNYSSSTKKYGAYSATFNGTDNYFASANSLLNNLSAFSVVGWVYVHGHSGSGHISFWGQNNLMELGFNDAGNDVCVWVEGSTEQCSATQLSLDTWYHIAVTMGSGNGTRLYINGTQVATTAVTTTQNSSAYPFQIGGGVWNASGDYLNGNVDDVTIYSRELSSTEVQQQYGSYSN